MKSLNIIKEKINRHERKNIYEIKKIKNNKLWKNTNKLKKQEKEKSHCLEEQDRKKHNSRTRKRRIKKFLGKYNIIQKNYGMKKQKIHTKQIQKHIKILE